MPIVHVVTGKVLEQWLSSAIADLLAAAGEPSCLVTSVARSPEEQAAAMLWNCRHTNAQRQLEIYGPSGDEVIKVFQANPEMEDDRLVQLMTKKIMEVGPGNVSHHCLGPNSNRGVVDIAQASISDHNRFRSACGSSQSVAKILIENDCFHIEFFKLLPIGG